MPKREIKRLQELNQRLEEQLAAANANATDWMHRYASAAATVNEVKRRISAHRVAGGSAHEALLDIATTIEAKRNGATIVSEIHWELLGTLIRAWRIRAPDSERSDEVTRWLQSQRSSLSERQDANRQAV